MAFKKQVRKNTKLVLGGVALAAGALGAIGAILIKKKNGAGRIRRRDRSQPVDLWARPGMKVTFRAEVMPGRETHERTYHVAKLLPSGRVLLDTVVGEHARREFEPIR